VKGTVFLISILFLVIISPVFAHQSGCHRWHSCPSDSGSYICGDIGYCSQCSDNQYCKSGHPRTSDENVQSQTQMPDISTQKIPEWIKTSVSWWSQDLVDDSEFISSMEYLIDNRILDVPFSTLDGLKEQYHLPAYREDREIPVTGTVNEFRKGAYVELQLEKPDGTEMKFRAIVAQIVNDATNRGAYSTVVKISHDFPIGTYKITGKYLGELIPVTDFEIIEEPEVEEFLPIPAWIKNNAKWWSQSLISEDDFLSGIQYLISNGIIRV